MSAGPVVLSLARHSSSWSVSADVAIPVGIGTFTCRELIVDGALGKDSVY
jgi:hypothetical protein